MSVYDLLKTVHVLAIVAWVGSAFLQTVLAERARRADRAVRHAVLEDASFAGRRIYPVAAVVALLTGVLMVLDAEHVGFGDLWVTLAMTGWLVSAVNGGVVISRAVEAAKRDDAAYGRVLALTRVDLLVLVLVIVDMVVKPG